MCSILFFEYLYIVDPSVYINEIATEYKEVFLEAQEYK